ncbi:autotransporter-associated beta strand repeat-containing protein, partial [Brucella sp. NBRC 12953]|uniref:beta strand repeat-containing protein n=1 Tax=Brucella sp. NBRC 12953 TaxID=3075481 RepID=UPI00333E369F
MPVQLSAIQGEICVRMMRRHRDHCRNSASSLMIAIASTAMLLGTGAAQAVDITNGSTLTVNQDSDFGAAGPVNFTGSGGTVNFTASFVSDRNFRFAAGSTGTLTVGAGLTDQIGSASGTGTLVKDGAGTLKIKNGIDVGSVVVNAGILDFSGLIVADDMTVNNGGAVAFSQTVNMEYKNVISGTGGLIKNGSNRLELWGQNTYTGTTYINGGTLQLGDLTGTGSGDSTTYYGAIAGDVVNNGVLDFYQYRKADTAPAPAPAGTLAITDDAVNFKGQISGTGSVSIRNQMQLSGNNSYTGGTRLTSAVYITANANLGAASGDLTFSGGGQIVLGTSFDMARSIHLLGSGRFQQSQDNMNTTLSGVIDGGGSLTLYTQGGGKITLTGNNTYTGLTSISGNVQIGNGGTSGSIVGNVQNLGTLTFNRSDTSRYAGRHYGSGQLIKNGTGTLILTGSNEMTGGTTINAGTLQIGENDSATGSINGPITNHGTLQFSGQNIVVSGIISGTGKVVQNGLMTTLSGNNEYSGGTYIERGILQISSNNNLGGPKSDIYFTGPSTLRLLAAMDSPRAVHLNGAAGTLDTNGFNSTFSGPIDGSGTLIKAGAGTLTLTGKNSYTGGTTLTGGTLFLTADDDLGAISGALRFAGGTLLADANNPFSIARPIIVDTAGGTIQTDQDITLAGAISGSGTLAKTGSDRLILSGNSGTFSGDMAVNQGTLIVNGTLGGAVLVNNQSVLGGEGSILGKTTVKSGGTLAGASGKTLTFGSDLDLQAGSSIHVTLAAAPDTHEMFHVNGDLTLNGVINVDTPQQPTPGLYRIFQYDGQLHGNGLLLGTVDGVSGNPDWSVQTAAPHQVNLLHAPGMEFNFWNGSNTAPNGTINGGDGTWNTTTNNWTNEDGSIVSIWTNDRLAIFEGTAGTVTIANGGSLKTTGLIFMSDGYHLTGDTIALDKVDGNAPVIQVGDFNDDSKAWSATIDTVLTGQDGLHKTGNGTLILTRDAQYSGLTTIAAGTLQLGDGHAAGSIDTDVVLAGTHFDDAALIFDRSDDIGFSHTISGVGEVFKRGAGTTTFSGDNSFSGGLNVEAGTAKAGIADHAFGSGRVKIASGATLDLADLNQTIGGLDGLNPVDGNGQDGNITLGAGTLTLNQDLHGDYSGVISGSGGIIKNGAGDLV